MIIRLQKYLADAGIASRRKAEELILDGKITVNHAVVTELGTKVNIEKDKVMYNQQVVRISKKHIYIMLHKPEGYVTTAKDQFNRPTVLDLLEGINKRLVPVGRLDYNTSGLLLLTNDGGLTYKLTHPKHNIEKTYIAKVKGIPSEADLVRFRRGLSIEDYKTAPAKIQIIKVNENTCSLRIAIHEGRNRQVRKMCEAIGYPILHLKRVSTGNIFLGELKKGEYRNLTLSEVNYLKSL